MITIISKPHSIPSVLLLYFVSVLDVGEDSYDILAGYIRKISDAQQVNGVINMPEFNASFVYGIGATPEVLSISVAMIEG